MSGTRLAVQFIQSASLGHLLSHCSIFQVLFSELQVSAAAVMPSYSLDHYTGLG